MTELSIEILENWQIRKSFRQKTDFIEFLKGRIPELEVETKRKNRNLVIGDIRSAKLVLTAHYDTCARMLIPNFLTPRNIPFYIIYQLLIVAVIAVIAIAAGVGVGLATGLEKLAQICALGVYFGILILMMCGPANRHTANDNTSGVITLIEIYSRMSREMRERVCFVFFDNEESGLLGSAAFNKMHKADMQTKLLMNFDCVSDGDHIMLVIKKKAERAYGETLRQAFTPAAGKDFVFASASTTVYPSDQKNFPVALAVSSFKRAPVIGYYMDRIHTDKDRSFDENNISIIRDNVLRFAEKIEGSKG